MEYGENSEYSKNNGINKLMYAYWINLQFGGNKKWKTFEHNGVSFPPSYVKHNIPVIYDGKEIILDEKAEEYATIYSKYVDTEYIKNNIFKRNFWKGWKRILGSVHMIKNLEGVDFSKIYNYVLKQKEKQSSMSKEEKEQIKEKRTKMEEKYKIAKIDGMEQQTGNFRIEPPGLFIGRGCHPLMGSLKERVMPEDITINISKEAVFPESMPGHKWGRIIHDPTLEWIASWIDNVTGKRKYVWLGAQSKFKSESDIKKFDLARKLKKHVGKLKQTIDEELSHEEETIRQVATALYIIDNLALRVGNEKGDDAADTVGVTSLRVEHIIFHDNNEITLDFLGKDSIRYKNSHTVDPKVYDNLKSFTKGKSPKNQLLDKIDSGFINRYLNSFMPNLTAKVFRTYNASNLFQKELNKVSRKMEDDNESNNESNNVNQILDQFNKANIKVALLCNHQKKVSGSFNKQLTKINELIENANDKIKKLRRSTKGSKKTKTNQITKLKNKVTELKAKKDIKIELKSVSLETSKANYIDPRITVAFIKKHNLPIDKIFSKNLQDKFNWALEIDENWKF
jgi:DNA topoisomerase-1